ncbi:MAG: hypothetical protein AAGN82_29310, partial [Myxococcota bacterium]
GKRYLGIAVLATCSVGCADEPAGNPNLATREAQVALVSGLQPVAPEHAWFRRNLAVVPADGAAKVLPLGADLRNTP